jgi:hypothetical protein
MTGHDCAVAGPALPLRPFVSHYAGSRMRDVPQGQHAGLPSRHIDLIVSLAKPIEIARMPGPQSPGTYHAFVAGLQQAPALVRMGGSLDCLHVFLKPGAAGALLGVSGRELAARVVHLADISGAMCTELTERLSGAHTWPQRFAAVDRVLLRTLRPVTVPDAMERAWRGLAMPMDRCPSTSLRATSASADAISASAFWPSSASCPKRRRESSGSSMPAACSCEPLAGSSTSRWHAASTTRATWCTSGTRWRAARLETGSSASSRFYKTMKSAAAMIEA